MIFTVFRRVAIGYGLILTLAAGGLAFANIFGFFATAIPFGGDTAPDPTAAKTWMHIGWVVGVVVAMLGATIKWRKGTAKRWHNERTQTMAQAPSENTAKVRRLRFFASAAWGGFYGTLLGAMLGATFVLLWFSITYSPFAPHDWGSSVSVEKQPRGRSQIERFVAVTDHPVAVLAFGLPVAFGTFAGAVFGGCIRASAE